MKKHVLLAKMLMIMTFSGLLTAFTSYLSAQTLTTVGASGYTGANGVGGNSAITFAIENTSGGPLMLNDLSSFWITGNNNTNVVLWATTTSLSGVTGGISNPVWQQVASGGPVAVPSDGIYPTLSGIGYVIPNGVTVRFALQSSNGIRYSGSAGPPTPNTFSSGGVTLLCGAAQIGGMNVGYGGAFPTPTNQPRWFTGSVTLIVPPVCSQPNTLSTSLTSNTTANHTWNAPPSAPSDGYEWAVTTSATPPASGTATMTLGSSSTGNTPDVTNYLHVRSNCGVNGFSAWSTSSFFSGHCLASGTSANTQITNVTATGLTTLNNTSATNAGYGNFTSITPTVSGYEGQTISFSVSATSDPGHAIYVDWNNDLVFAISERMYTSNAWIVGSSVGTFAVPAAQPNGSYRMRVVADWNSQNPVACPANINGETEDYLFNVVDEPTCFLPTNLTNTPVSLTAANHSWTAPVMGTPIGYEWAVTSSATPPASGTFTVSLSASSTGLTTGDTYYLHVRTDCGAGDFSDWATISFVLGYCEDPNYSLGDLGCANNFGITNVTFGDLNNTSGCVASAPFFTFFNSPQANLLIGETYPLSVALQGTTSFITYIKVFIDFNENGEFDDAGELIYNSGDVGTVPGPFGTNYIIPAVTPGQYRMRVRSMDADANSCSGDGIVGEVEDYLINIALPPTCSGTPNAGTATISHTIGCANMDLTLTATGVTIDQGIAYQWQSSPDGFAPWTDIIGANSSTYVANSATNIFYRMKTICTSSSEENFTNTVSFEASNASVYCENYCETPVYSLGNLTCANNFGITNVTFADLNNTTACNGTAPNFTLYHTPQANLFTETPYPLSVSLQGTTAFITYVKVYIDFDQNGSFDDAGEEVYNSGQVANQAGPFGANITIPVSVSAGQYRMRVRSMDADANSCSVDGIIGEVEDYILNIQPLPACTGTPNPGLTLSGLTDACYDIDFTLSLENETTGSGVTYQWQTSPNNMDWNDFIGATNETQVFTQTGSLWYRCVVTCTASAESTPSVAIEVQLSAPTECYCEPTYDFGKTAGDLISNVVIPGTTLSNNSGTAQVNPAYTFFTGQPNFTANLVAGGSYNVTVEIGSWGNQHIRAWIDYNDDGVFDNAESLGNSIIAPNLGFGGPYPPAVFNVVLANNAPLGMHRMRIRTVWSGIADPVLAATIDPCALYAYGETEDYDVTIIPPVTTGLNSSACGASNVALDQALFAGLVGQPAYRFRVTGNNNASWMNNQLVIDRTVRWIKFVPQVPGAITGETYDIEVAVGDGFGNFGPYSSVCPVTLTAAQPTTQLNTAACGATNVDPATGLFANQVFEAQGYRFRISGANTGAQGWVNNQFILVRAERWFKFAPHVPGFVNGETYDVEVAVLLNDGITYGPYGTLCEVTLSGTPNLVLDENEISMSDKSLVEVVFGANASHNPFTTEFGLQVLNANDSETINVVIYDMSGKLIERHAVNPMDIEVATFGSNLASGMYMVEVRQGANQAVIRQVKN